MRPFWPIKWIECQECQGPFWPKCEIITAAAARRFYNIGRSVCLYVTHLSGEVRWSYVGSVRHVPAGGLHASNTRKYSCPVESWCSLVVIMGAICAKQKYVWEPHRTHKTLLILIELRWDVQQQQLCFVTFNSFLYCRNWSKQLAKHGSQSQAGWIDICIIDQKCWIAFLQCI